jgi:hypothetical protein
VDKFEPVDVHRVQDLLDRQALFLWEGPHPATRACGSAKALYCSYHRCLGMCLLINVPQILPTCDTCEQLYTVPFRTS